jgi:ABC-type multidrug transport system, ATPase component
MKLKVENITRTFGENKALDSISLEIEGGHIYGLLGRNGAGKSTLLNIMTDRVYATSGDILMEGVPIRNNNLMQRRIHLMSEAEFYPDDMKAGKIFKAIAALRDNFDYPKAMEMAERFELNLMKNIKQLSTGYRTIFKLVAALSFKCDLLLLDEPTLGLDAVARDILYGEIATWMAENSESAIVLSTHLIEEVESLVDRFFLIDHGRLMLSGDTEEVKNEMLIVSGSKENVDKAVSGAMVLSSSIVLEREECLVKGSLGTTEGVEIVHPGLQELFIKLAGARK